MFYAALHYIQGYFVAIGMSPPPSTHKIRNNHVSNDKKLSAIYVDYRELQDESRSSRYGVIAPDQADVTRLQGNLNTIKKLVISDIS